MGASGSLTQARVGQLRSPPYGAECRPRRRAAIGRQRGRECGGADGAAASAAECGARPAGPRDGPPAAAVGPAGPVRRLLRGRRAGLLRGRGPRPHDRRRRPDVVPQTVGSAANGPEFTIAWVPKVLQAREGRRRRTSSTSPRSSSAPARCRCRGRTRTSPSPPTSRARRSASGTSATSSRSRPAPRRSASSQGTDYTKVIQPFDMTLLLSKQIDVAEAMIYNEYAQVLEAKNPETGELVQARRPQRHQLQRRRHRDAPGRALRARLVARTAGNEDVAVRFLKASFKGWIYCRDHPADCVQYTLNAGSTLGAGHQAWKMNEINPLVWPSPNGIGIMDPALWKQTVDISLAAGIIKAAPPAEAARTDLAQQALDAITDGHQGRRLHEGHRRGDRRRQLSPVDAVTMGRSSFGGAGPSDSRVPQDGAGLAGLPGSRRRTGPGPSRPRARSGPARRPRHARVQAHPLALLVAYCPPALVSVDKTPSLT